MRSLMASGVRLWRVLVCRGCGFFSAFQTVKASSAPANHRFSPGSPSRERWLRSRLIEPSPVIFRCTFYPDQSTVSKERYLWITPKRGATAISRAVNTS